MKYMVNTKQKSTRYVKEIKGNPNITLQKAINITREESKKIRKEHRTIKTIRKQ